MQCVPDAYGRGPPHLGAVPHAQSTVGGAVWPLSSPLTSGSSVVLWALPSQRLHPGLLGPFLSAIAPLLHAHAVSPLGHERGQAVPGSLLPSPPSLPRGLCARSQVSVRLPAAPHFRCLLREALMATVKEGHRPQPQTPSLALLSFSVTTV